MKARTDLRAGTAAEHARVDALFSRYNLTDLEGYRRFLLAQAAAFIPIEAALSGAGVAEVLADWPARRRAHLLESDLAQLGETAPEQISPPDFSDAASMVGAVYVLEGSRLGAKLLRKRLPPGSPRRFLDADQEAGSWRKLLERLDNLLYRPEQLDAAIAAAKEVFQRFEAGGLRYLETN